MRKVGGSPGRYGLVALGKRELENGALNTKVKK